MLPSLLLQFSKILKLPQLLNIIDAWDHQTTSRFSLHSLPAHIFQPAKIIHQWIKILQNFFFCFTILPWHHSLPRAFYTEPRLFLTDWASISDKHLKLQNLVASHLLKAILFWNQFQHGQFSLFYLQDRHKRFVDFLITNNSKPWLLIYVDTHNSNLLNPDLNYFHSKLNTTYAVQLASHLPYVDRDFRTLQTPKIFPITTFLSQLI
ncbi:DUF4143 domain-containing protein [Rickettsiales endosymbiont of Peranema trichophorum]|uniref:DUF4143 domain-containing protein n=1 Tax=Rickettsiales endosymbiont of Peranema trichophorum TaxID=2486577 RepID=UPI00397CFB14